MQDYIQARPVRSSAGFGVVNTGVAFLLGELVQYSGTNYIGTAEGKYVGGGGGDVLDRRCVLDLMHGRSCTTMDPHIPTMPGRRGGWRRAALIVIHKERVQTTLMG